jgi:hypothetical protein
LRLNNKFVFGLLFAAFLYSFTTSAQLYPSAPVTTGYFMFPIMPGQQNYLSGSMGEIRPNHFHGGIDIKTNQQTGLPVFAAADGYISRIEVSSYGYGWQLYLTHPNGLITTYGHLESFAPAIADYVLKQQYEKESFDVRLTPVPNQFMFKKGDIIATSGNTGGSAGPHLHFEVRDERNKLLNPLKYGFTEIQDNIPPSFLAVALKTLSIDGRVNNRFGRFEYVPVKQGDIYVIPDTLTAHGLIGLEVQAFDRLTGAANKNGVQQVDVLVDGKPYYTHLIDGVPFELNKQVSWHINYEFYKGTGRNFQKCYVDDGNLLPLYNTGGARGKLFIQSGAFHQVTMLLKDSYNNTTTLQFRVKGQAPAFFATKSPAVKKPDISYEIAENLLKVVTADTARQAAPIQLFVHKTKYDLVPSYTQASNTVYLYDLRGGLPDSMTWNGFIRKFNLQQAIPAGTEYTFANRFMNITFEKGSLFDTLYLNTSYNNGVYSINSPLTPVFDPLKVTLKAEKIADKSRAHVYYLGWGKSRAFLGGTWNGDQITFQARNLGQFKVLYDTKAPTVRLISKTPQEIKLKIGDDLSGVATYRAELNGQFLLLKYEHKNALLYSERLDKTSPLKGDLVVRLKDSAGNEGILRTRL